MKLYYSPAACSLAVHIVAREADLPIETIKVNIETHRLEDGTDFYAINPRGYVPVLELDDGTRITEVAALVQYVADLAPEAALIPPAGSIERVQRATQSVQLALAQEHRRVDEAERARAPGTSLRRARRVAGGAAVLDGPLHRRGRVCVHDPELGAHASRRPECVPRAGGVHHASGIATARARRADGRRTGPQSRMIEDRRIAT
jgi:glutathione S-transferase